MIVLLSACSAVFGPVYSPVPESMLFKKGNYRQDGTCTKLLLARLELTPTCNNYIGVIVLVANRPLFTFSTQNGDFFAFTTSNAPTYTKDNNTAVYPISHIYQNSTQRDIYFKGECRISKDGEYEDIDCITWKDDNRIQEAWHASFVGKGGWRPTN